MSYLSTDLAQREFHLAFMALSFLSISGLSGSGLLSFMERPILFTPS